MIDKLTNIYYLQVQVHMCVWRALPSFGRGRPENIVLMLAAPEPPKKLDATLDELVAIFERVGFESPSPRGFPIA